MLIRRSSCWSKKREAQGEKGVTASYIGFAPTYDQENLTDSVQAQRMARLYREAWEDFSPLSHNKEEVEKAVQVMGGYIFTDTAATERTYKREAPQHGIIHLACHAFTNDSLPLQSGLVFSRQHDSTEDGFLHAWEIYGKALHAELAVLSACNTGVGKLHRGEGIMSLARAFRYAGCPNIAMSLWNVDDEAASLLMEQFYKKLREGLPKDEALRQARLYLLNEEHAHPYYWGAFVLIGDDAAIELKENRNLWYLLLSGGLMTLAFWGYRRRVKRSASRNPFSAIKT